MWKKLCVYLCFPRLRIRFVWSETFKCVKLLQIISVSVENYFWGYFYIARKKKMPLCPTFYLCFCILLWNIILEPQLSWLTLNQLYRRDYWKSLKRSKSLKSIKEKKHEDLFCCCNTFFFFLCFPVSHLKTKTFSGRSQDPEWGCVGRHQLHQWGKSGPSGLPSPLQRAGATAQPADRERQQDDPGDPGSSL